MSLEKISETENRNTFNYIVDYIIGKRKGSNGKIEYLVKWEGWPSSAATWEPQHHFASRKIVDIFEQGLQSQMRVSAMNAMSDTKARKHKTRKTTNGPKTAKRGRPAYKLLEQYRKQYMKRNSKTSRYQLNVSDYQLNDMFNGRNNSSLNGEMGSIARYEKLIGASKRKSRMSCPSIMVASNKCCVTPLSVTQRSERYKIREQLKVNPIHSENSIQISNELNESHEENKNPQIMKQSKTSCDNEVSGKKRFTIEISALNNKKIKNDNLNNIHSIQCIESPVKLFLNKVRDRFLRNPTVYQQFLTEIIEFNKRKIELSNLFGNNIELMNELFHILIINRQRNANNNSQITAFKTNEEINHEIINWYHKITKCLSSEEEFKFWCFMRNQSCDSVLMASPQSLYLKIVDILHQNKDLIDEFKLYMPNLCSNQISFNS